MVKWMHELQITGGFEGQAASFEPADNSAKEHHPHFTGEERAVQRAEAADPEATPGLWPQWI